jgi:hypothetical protein
LNVCLSCPLFLMPVAFSRSLALRASLLWITKQQQGTGGARGYAATGMEHNTRAGWPVTASEAVTAA